MKSKTILSTAIALISVAILVLLFVLLSPAQNNQPPGTHVLPNANGTVAWDDAGKPVPKTFEVTFSITFNAIPLEQAARLERVIRGEYKKACKVDVQVKEVQRSIGGWTASGSVMYLNGNQNNLLLYGTVRDTVPENAQGKIDPVSNNGQPNRNAVHR